MSPLPVLLLLATAWIAFLVVERVLLEKRREAVPLRIAVTGTRGKTTVTRLLASVLRESGRTVLAKSTGSEAAYVFPDGTDHEIHRLGAPSIIEQKRLLKWGARMGVDAVVAEVMAVHPEYHRVEVQRILRPPLVLVTNFHVDHVEAHGTSREAVASVLALDVPPGTRAMVPEGEWEEAFRRAVEAVGGVVESVPAGSGTAPEGCGEFESNLDLVWAAARSLGIDASHIRKGVTRAHGDLGALRIWEYAPPGAARPWTVVNAFAANDPESTFRIHDRVLEREGVSAETCTGLLSLRADRGDRTLQWVEALGSGGLDRFGRLLVTGLHARALRHRLRKGPGAGKIEILKPARPAVVMEKVIEGGPGSFLFGFGNIGGMGETLVRHWDQVGEPHGI